MSVTTFAFNYLLPVQRFITASYTDQHNTTSVDGCKARRAGAARELLHCACRTSTVSSCAFHEQWRSALHLLSSLYPLVEGGGWLWCSSLRTSREHRFTVRTLGAGGAPGRRTITFSSAHPSTLSPPSLSAAPRPWLVRAPSRRQGAAVETLQQRPSCAPHLF
jgi:hypothetical protein